ncbi:hypothetical protein GOPIP_028_00430 [Gordonia polyisoprenivorans NBRC 16320 = JCM 10675]|nr:hypothetical protein GOPIP_028_00430 [Gordonia polyisoprenivorans NBRC 16320 = JCM 10675]
MHRGTRQRETHTADLGSTNEEEPIMAAPRRNNNPAPVQRRRRVRRYDPRSRQWLWVWQ